MKLPDKFSCQINKFDFFYPCFDVSPVKAVFRINILLYASIYYPHMHLYTYTLAHILAIILPRLMFKYSTVRMDRGTNSLQQILSFHTRKKVSSLFGELQCMLNVNIFWDQCFILTCHSTYTFGSGP